MKQILQQFRNRKYVTGGGALSALGKMIRSQEDRNQYEDGRCDSLTVGRCDGVKLADAGFWPVLHCVLFFLLAFFISSIFFSALPAVASERRKATVAAPEYRIPQNPTVGNCKLRKGE